MGKWLAGLALLVLVGCGDGKDPTEPDVTIDGRWRAVSGDTTYVMEIDHPNRRQGNLNISGIGTFRRPGQADVAFEISGLADGFGVEMTLSGLPGAPFVRYAGRLVSDRFVEGDLRVTHIDRVENYFLDLERRR